MKIFFTILCISILSSFTLSAQWKQCASGPYGVYPKSFGAVGSTLFVGTFGGVHKSTDSGATWSPTSLKLRRIASVQSFAVIGKTVFASSDEDEVFRSSDNGNTWVNVTNNLILHDITIAANSKVLFARGYPCGYRSTDLGDTWIKMDIPNFVPNAFETLGETVFALTVKGVFRSLDNGISWKLVRYFNDTLKLSVLKCVGSVLYGKSEFLFYYSTDGGNYWDVPSTKFDPMYTRCMDMHGKYLFAGTWLNGLYKSSDNGTSWKAIAFPKKNVSDVFTYGDRVFVAVEDSIFVSRNDGNSWQPADNGLLSQFLSYTFANGSTIFATATTNSYITGLFKSTDNGDTWAKISNDTPRDMIVADRKIFTTFDGRLQRSSDNGLTWDTVITQLPNAGITCFANNGISIFIGTRGVYKSSDYGISWVEKSSGLPKGRYINSMKANATTLYATTSDTVTTIYRSVDNGDSWTKLNGVPFKKYTQSIAVGNSSFFVLTEAGIFCSHDNGNTWDSINVSGKYYLSVVSIGNSLFAGTDYGVFHSTDDGFTWSTFTEGLLKPEITSLTANGTTLFAGSYGLGVWKIDVTSVEVEEIMQVLQTVASINCYPNPATNTLTIDRTPQQFPENTPIHYTLSTLIGGKVMEFDNTEMKFTVSLDGIANGVYSLTAESGGNRATVMVNIVAQ